MATVTKEIRKLRENPTYSFMPGSMKTYVTVTIL